MKLCVILHAPIDAHKLEKELPFLKRIEEEQDSGPSTFGGPG